MTDFELYEYSENKLKEARKRIEELEKENAELKSELKAIDEAGEHARQQINDAFRNKKPYWELEKENAEPKERNAELKGMYAHSAREAETYKQFLELKEKENSELNETLGKCAKMPVLYCLGAKETITKAKEIIKKFSEFANLEVEYDPEHPQKHTDLWNELCKEAEQFISEVEK